jgi:hypothetical protein
VCAGDETGYVEEFDGDRSPTVIAGAIVGFTSVGDVEAYAGAFYLQIAYCALGIDSCEGEVA